MVAGVVFLQGVCSSGPWSPVSFPLQDRIVGGINLAIAMILGVLALPIDRCNTPESKMVPSPSR